MHKDVLDKEGRNFFYKYIFLERRRVKRKINN